MFVITFTQPTMEDAATIIDLRRARNRESKTRSRANETNVKREAEKIRVHERMARHPTLRHRRPRRRLCHCHPHADEGGGGIDLKKGTRQVAVDEDESRQRRRRQ